MIPMNEQENILEFPKTDELVCLNCGSRSVRTEVIEQTFPYGVGEDEVTLQASVPVRKCADCGFSYTDEEGEDARHEAVCRHLGVMTPREIVGVWKRLGMSVAEFARLTGIGAASLHRWESGALIQNTANDQFLFLMTFRDNVERLKSRDRKAPVPEFADSERSAAPLRHPKFRTITASDDLRRVASKFALRTG